LERRTSTGTIDQSFSSHWSKGGFDDKIRTLAIQKDGKILVGGDFRRFNGRDVHGLVRLNSDGSPDEAFISNINTRLNDAVYQILVLGDGSILLGGAFSSYGDLPVPFHLKLKPDGSLDDQFQFDHQLDAPVISAFYDQENGVIALGGGFRDQKSKSRPLVQMTEAGKAINYMRLNLK